RANAKGMDVEQDEIGEDKEVEAAFVDALAALGSDPVDHLLRLPADLRAHGFAKRGFPVGNRAAPGAIIFSNAMTIAEARHMALSGFKVGNDPGHLVEEIVDITGMGVGPMVDVDAVLRETFPVAPDAVLVRSAHHFHRLGGLVHHDVDIFLGAGEIFLKRHDVLLEAYEIKAAIGFQPRNGLEIDFSAGVELFVEAIAALDVDELSVVVPGPAVIDAGEILRLAVAVAHDLGAAMRADIDEAAHFVRAAANEDERAACDRARQVAVGLLQFGLVPDIQPALTKN